MGRRSLAVTRLVLLLVAAACVAIGLGYWINGLTQAGGIVHVPVDLRATTSSGAEAVGQNGLVVTTFSSSAYATAESSGVSLYAINSTILEQGLAKAGVLLGGLALGIAIYIFRDLVTSIATGAPFDARNPKRLGWLAILVAVAGTVAPLLPHVASVLVLSRLSFDGSEFQPSANLAPDLAPILVSLMLVGLSLAFRRGAALQQEVETLV